MIAPLLLLVGATIAKAALPKALVTFANAPIVGLIAPTVKVAVAVPSLVLGHLRERFASVWPAVGVHAVYNAGFGLIAWLVAAG